MNPIAKMLVNMARFYDFALAEQQLELFINVLAQFPQEQVLAAGKKYILDIKNSRFPIPIHKIMVSDQISERDVANEMARKIDKAVAKYGYIWHQGIFTIDGTYWEGNGARWPTFKQAVIAELGDIGWYVICSRGGWLSVRNSSNEMDEGQFIAQIRDQIESAIKLKAAGIDVALMALPTSENKTQSSELTSINNITKLIPERQS